MKIRKKLISLGLAVAMIATPACSVLENFGVHVGISVHAATNSKKTNAQNDGTIQNEEDLKYACTHNGTYTLTRDVPVSGGIEVTATVTIVSKQLGTSPNVIYTKNSDAFNVLHIKGGNLTLGSSTNQSNVVVRGGTTDAAYVQTAAIVLNSGTLTINSAVIGKSKKVAIRAANHSQVIMNGGYIQNIQNTNCVAGAVVLTPESNTNMPSTFEMNGGTITKNTCGGVFVGKGCTFNMKGGTITKNSGGAGDPAVTPNVLGGVKFTGYGGGVYNTGTFNMSGGTIDGNSAQVKCGGVYNAGNFNMTGGSISNNVYGGIYNTNTFAMSAGTITGNTALPSEGAGSGVYNTGNANMYISGNISIGNDVAAFGGAKLSITGPISSSIPVTLENPTLGATVLYTPGATGNDYVKAINVTNLPRGCFLAGDGDRVVISQNTKVSYDLDGDGIADEGRSMNVTYNSPFTVETYERILEKVKNLSKYRYYDLDKEYMQSAGSNIAYGQTINPTGEVLLSAKWTPKKFTVTYDYNGGKSTSGQESHSINTDYEKGFTVDFDNVPVREGYEFLGWSTKKDATEATYKETALEKNYYSDVTLYAVWEVQGIIITYDTGSGSAIQATVGTAENPPVVTDETPKWEGYKFKGWYDANGYRYYPNNTVPSNVTLIAKWIDENVDWDVKILNTSKIKLSLHDKNSPDTTYTKFKKPLVLYVKGALTTSEGTSNAILEYQLVEKGKDVEMKGKEWPRVPEDGKITISDHKSCRLFIRAIVDGTVNMYATNGFVVDTKAPTVSGVKNSKIYKKAVTIRVSDQVSGVKKITLNGKKIKSGQRIKKNGVYKLVATDNSGHKKVIRFAIRK